METILIILTSTIVAGFLFISYMLGYHNGLASQKEESLEMSDKNMEAIKGMAEWMNYRG